MQQAQSTQDLQYERWETKQQPEQDQTPRDYNNNGSKRTKEA